MIFLTAGAAHVIYDAMVALVQRVSGARVDVDGRNVASIGRGLLVFLCVVKGDTDVDIDYLVKKVSRLRVFEDSKGRMNLSVQDVKGEVLVVSQFTLAADTRKGNRPSFDMAEEPGRAEEMYARFINRLRDFGIAVQSGVFAASMAVSLTNDGPVTISIDSRG